MSFARRALQSRRLLTTRSTFSARGQTNSRAWNLTTRRGYASGGHEEHKAGSDVPWMIGATVVTVPGAFWLWQQGPTDDGHGHGHDDHGEHAEEHGSAEETHDTEEEEKGNGKEDKAADGTDPAKDKDSNEPEPEPEPKSDDEEEDKKDEKPKKEDKPKKDDAKKADKPEEKADSESDSDSADDGKDTPDTSDDEKEAEDSGSNKVGGKPYSSLQPDKTQNQGAAGYKEKVGQTEGEGPKAASSAMHRARDHSDKTLSKKSEGYHDTARVQEPVDPFRKAK